MTKTQSADFENITPDGYMRFDEAAVTHTESWEHWVLYPGIELDVQFRDDEGYITEAGVVTENAAITDIDVWDESGTVVLYGNENGVRFQVEASVDPWTPVRLVDGRTGMEA